MRLSTIRAGIVATAAAVALAACAGHGVVPTSTVPDQSAPGASLMQPSELQPAITTCAKSPPQYLWIFKGACEPKINLKSTGASFSLEAYDSITVKGSIGDNNAKGTVVITLADATDTNGDIEADKGKAFPKYTGRGKTFIYAVAVNASTQIIKPVSGKKPVLQYIITDSKGLPGKTCGVALLNKSQAGKFVWTAFPGTFTVKGNTVTITQYNVPKGFAIPPKTPVYFGVNCF